MSGQLARVQAVAVVNPRASQGGASRWWPRVQEVLRHAYTDLQVLQTEAPEHATELTRQALEDGAELIIGVGGDGTNNEVLTGFLDENGKNRFPDARLGIVATGTGGDFRRGFGSCSPIEQAERLFSAAPRQVDYGVVRYTDHHGKPALRPFLNVCSVGISGLVDRYVGLSGRALGNTATYAVASLRAIVNYRNMPVRVEIDGDAENARVVDLTLLVLGNGQYFGAGMWVCPDASLDDGELDFVLLPGFGRLELVRTLGSVYKGQHLTRPRVESQRVTTLRLEPVESGSEVLIDLDGEQPGRLPASFSIEPKALTLQIA